jgi:two-component system KDP operon response regulator KdpE
MRVGVWTNCDRPEIQIACQPLYNGWKVTSALFNMAALWRSFSRKRIYFKPVRATSKESSDRLTHTSDQPERGHGSMAAKGRILIVDDEPGFRSVLGTALRALDFDVMETANGQEALTAVANQPIDVVLLDVNMPGIDGIETCGELRKRHSTLQILMLTVRDSEQDKIAALDAGADDYIIKPFSVTELTARLRSALRRANIQSGKTIKIGEIELDPVYRTVSKAGKSVHTSEKEFDLLRCLMERAGCPVTHTKLLTAVWGAGHESNREYLRAFVYSLRKKLERDPAEPQYLLTEAYFGYRFREE